VNGLVLDLGKNKKENPGKEMNRSSKNKKINKKRRYRITKEEK